MIEPASVNRSNGKQRKVLSISRPSFHCALKAESKMNIE